MPSYQTPSRLKIAILAPGLGISRRGYETAALRWHTALTGDAAVESRLLCGGRAMGGSCVPCVHRDGTLVRLAKRLGLAQDGCRIEQITFGFALIPYLLRSRPDVVWLQEHPLAHLLVRIRKITKLGFRIVFCNGAPVSAKYCVEFDHVQQLHRRGMREAIEAGISGDRLTELPHCAETPVVQDSCVTLRARYGIPEDAFVIVSVAAINAHHKRIDYLIEEAAQMEGGVYLVLCGQVESGSEELFALADERLGNRYKHLQVPPEEVSAVLKSADLFVLASLSEGLGFVLVEAALCEIPIVCHHHAGSEEILGRDYPFADLASSGGLVHAVRERRASPPTKESLRMISRDIAARFGQDALRPRFTRMLWKASGLSSEERS